MGDRKISFSVGLCPKDDCNNRPSPMYTEEEWRGFVNDGKVPFHCPMCDGDYELTLIKQRKATILNLLQEISN